MGTLAALLGLGALSHEALVDVGDDTATSDGRLDELIQFLVTTDGKLQMTRGDTLHAQITGGVSCQFKHLQARTSVPIAISTAGCAHKLLTSAHRYSMIAAM